MVQEPTSESEALLMYAAYEALDMGCYRVLGPCITCKHMGGCKLFFIHDAICGKLGTTSEEWTKFKNWAKKWRQDHLDLVKTKF